MKAKIYNLMDWARIEGIVYGEDDRPGTFLGAHQAGNSILFQVFYPDAAKVSLVIDGNNKKVVMDEADEEGFFAACVTGKKAGNYYYEVVNKEGKKEIRQDPYKYYWEPEKEQVDLYHQGIQYSLWKLMGSHKATIEKEEGITFLVSVPSAIRVSLVGKFNSWDGRVCPMNRVGESDIFALFYPGLNCDSEYMYEVKRRDGSTYLLKDPFSVFMEGEKDVVSKVYDCEEFKWKDKKWMDSERGSVINPVIWSYGGEEYNSKSFFADIRNIGYTHISLPAHQSKEYFYAAPSCFSSMGEMKRFINEAHNSGLSVIFNWKASHCKGLERKETRNYYLANVLFYLEEFHLDGLILSDMAELLYLDYNKRPGDWVSNIYGGNENLDGVELVKHLVSILRKRFPHILLIADLDALWNGVTNDLSEGGLGFDFRFDTDFTKKIIDYVCAPQWQKEEKHHYLSKRMEYADEQKFLMAFEQNKIFSLSEKIKEDGENGFKLLKILLSYMSFLPGDMLQGFVFPEPWDKEGKELLKKANEMKKIMDNNSENNFFFIKKDQNKEGIISFFWNNKLEEESYLVVVNFSAQIRERFGIGVPYEGKYESVFDTQIKAFGGDVLTLSSVISTKEEIWDGFNYKVEVDAEPLSLKVFRYFPFTEEEIMDMAQKKAEEIRIRLEQEAKEKIAMLHQRKREREKQ